MHWRRLLLRAVGELAAALTYRAMRPRDEPPQL